MSCKSVNQFQIRSLFLISLVMMIIGPVSNAQQALTQKKICVEVLQTISGKSHSEILEQIGKKYPSCANWLANSCFSSYRLDQRTDFVQALMEKPIFEGTSCVECSQGSSKGLQRSAEILKPLVGHLKESADPHRPQAHQAELVRVTLAYWHLVNQKRDQDLSTLLSYFQKEELPSSLTEKDSFLAIETLEARINKAAERAGTQEKIMFQKFVAEQIADAGQDTSVPWVDTNGSPHNDFYEGFHSRLKREKSDSDRFQLLVQRAQKVDDDNDVEFDSNLTPYHSKMILLYHFENQIRKKYEKDPLKAENILNEVATKLHLKVDFSHTKGKSLWRWIIPHDGFVLGAHQNQILNLLKSESASNSPNGTGVDCATYVHQMLNGTGYKNLAQGQRMTTAGIATGGQLDGIAKLQRIKTETISEIQPGDLIVKREKNESVGHVEIVVGYEGDPPQLVTISASGGYQRTVFKKRINIFPNQPHSCSKDNYFMEHGEMTYYLAKLKKGPK